MHESAFAVFGTLIASAFGCGPEASVHPSSGIALAAAQQPERRLVEVYAASDGVRVAGFLDEPGRLVVFSDSERDAPRVWDGRELATMTDADEAERSGVPLGPGRWLTSARRGMRAARTSRPTSQSIALEVLPIEPGHTPLALDVDSFVALSATADLIAGFQHAELRGPRGVRVYDGQGALKRNVPYPDVFGIQAFTDRIVVRAADGMDVLDADGELVHELPAAFDLRSSPDGARHALFMDQGVVVYSGSEELFRMETHHTPRDAAFSASGDVLAIVDRWNVYRLRASTGEADWIRPHERWVEYRSVDVSPDGELIAVGRLRITRRPRRERGSPAASPGEAVATVGLFDASGALETSDGIPLTRWRLDTPRVSFRQGNELLVRSPASVHVWIQD